MENEHVWQQKIVFALATVDDHGAFEAGGGVVLSRADWDAFALDDLNFSFGTVEFEDLVCAFTHLSFRVEHETATENVHLALIQNSWVALTTLNLLKRWVGSALPDDLVTENLGFHNFLDSVRTHATDHESFEIVGSKRGAFTRHGGPSFALLLRTNFNTNTFTLLHALHISLNTTSQLLSQFIPWNILSRVGSESTSTLFIRGFRINENKLRSGSITIFLAHLVSDWGHSSRLFDRRHLALEVRLHVHLAIASFENWF